MKQITVEYHQEAGSWWAESADVEGFTAVAISFGELRRLAIDGLNFYLDTQEYLVHEYINGARVVESWPTPGPLFSGGTRSISGLIEALLPPAVAGPSRTPAAV